MKNKQKIAKYSPMNNKPGSAEATGSLLDNII